MLKNIVNPTSVEALKFIETYHKSKPDKTMLLLVGDCVTGGTINSFCSHPIKTKMIENMVNDFRDVIIFIVSYNKFEKAESKLKSLSMMSTYKIDTLTSTQNLVLKF